MAKPVTVNDVLDGQVALDLECLDRVYLNAWVNNLQVGGQVVSFLTAHLGNPIPSPAIFGKIGTAFRRAVGRFADTEHIPVVRRREPEVCGNGRPCSAATRLACSTEAESNDANMSDAVSLLIG